jgi:hypothetical protein
MNKILSTTALAGVLALGAPALVHAQAMGNQGGGTATQSGNLQSQGSAAANQGVQHQGSTMGSGVTGSGATATPAATQRMSDDELRNMLRQRGYSDVSDIRREGDNIRVRAKQNNRDVNLRIDGRTGEVSTN